MTNRTDNITLATEITIAWLANQNTRTIADQVPAFLAALHEALGRLDTHGTAATGTTKQASEYTPAVGARKALADPNYIISMIDGKKYRSLTRHLKANGLSPVEYRSRYGLKADFPMVAPGYSQARSDAAKKLGLGRKPGQKIGKPTDQEPPASKPRKGKSVAEAKAAAKAHLGGKE